MGSLASRPKAPSVQYVPVYMPAASSTSSGASLSVSETAASATSAETAPDETKSAQRAANLLERGRGRLSTVLTGFRGLLSDTLTPQRKNLLGE